MIKNLRGMNRESPRPFGDALIVWAARFLLVAVVGVFVGICRDAVAAGPWYMHGSGCVSPGFYETPADASAACDITTASWAANFVARNSGVQYPTEDTLTNGRIWKGRTGISRMLWLYECNAGYEFDSDTVSCVEVEGEDPPVCPEGTWVFDSETQVCVPSEWEGVNVDGLEIELVALGLVLCAVLGFIAARLR